MNKDKEKEWLSIDADDDDKNYSAFSSFLEHHTARQKDKAAFDILEMGEDLLTEIDEKKTIQDQEKEELIKYIIKKSEKYSPKILREYDISDVRDIHAEVKYENRPFWKKWIDLLT